MVKIKRLEKQITFHHTTTTTTFSKRAFGGWLQFPVLAMQVYRYSLQLGIPPMQVGAHSKR